MKKEILEKEDLIIQKLKEKENVESLQMIIRSHWKNTNKMTQKEQHYKNNEYFKEWKKSFDFDTLKKLGSLIKNDVLELKSNKIAFIQKYELNLENVNTIETMENYDFELVTGLIWLMDQLCNTSDGFVGTIVAKKYENDAKDVLKTFDINFVDEILRLNVVKIEMQKINEIYGTNATMFVDEKIRDYFYEFKSDRFMLMDQLLDILLEVYYDLFMIRYKENRIGYILKQKKNATLTTKTIKKVYELDKEYVNYTKKRKNKKESDLYWKYNDTRMMNNIYESFEKACDSVWEKLGVIREIKKIEKLVLRYFENNATYHYRNTYNKYNEFFSHFDEIKVEFAFNIENDKQKTMIEKIVNDLKMFFRTEININDKYVNEYNNSDVFIDNVVFNEIWENIIKKDLMFDKFIKSNKSDWKNVEKIIKERQSFLKEILKNEDLVWNKK